MAILRLIGLSLLAVLAMIGSANAFVICAPIEGFAAMSRNIVNPDTGNRYTLDGRGCTQIFDNSDMGYLTAQGFLLGVGGSAGTVTGSPNGTNVADYGAVCDGVTDDTVAINLAIDSIRTNTETQGKLIFPTNGKCKVTSPLNFTGFSSSGSVIGGRHVTIDGSGAVIYAAFSGSGARMGGLEPIVGGSGYTPGTYTNVPFISSTGLGAEATGTIVVSTAGVVTRASPTAGHSGGGYVQGDVVTVATANIGGTGSGFSATVAGESGNAVIDAMGSRFIRFLNLTIEGDCTLVPNIGVQIGRRTLSLTADTFVFDNIYITGCYKLAGFLNAGSEVLTVSHMYILNNQPSGNTFALVQDGINHWNIQSTFETAAWEPNNPTSFNDNLFINSNFITTANVTSGGVPIWFCRGFHHKFLTSYAAGKGIAGVILWAKDSTQFMEDITFDMHFETRGMKHVFWITGGWPDPIFRMLSFREMTPIIDEEVIGIDTTVNTVQFHNSSFEFPGTNPDGLSLVNSPAALTFFGGRAYMKYIDQFNLVEPHNRFSGTLCILETCQNWVPTRVINRNPDFSVDQVGGGYGDINNPAYGGNQITPPASGALVIDGWRLVATNAPTSWRFQQVPRAGSGNPYRYQENATLVTPTTPAASQVYSLETVVNGYEFDSLGYGSQASAKPLTLRICLSSNVPGDLDVYLQNEQRNLSYILPLTVDAASVFQCYNKVIPGSTSGTWLRYNNTVGLRLGITLGANSNLFAPTPDLWVAGEYYGYPGMNQSWATAGAVIKLASVHVIPGQFDLPYEQRPPAEEINLSRQHFQTSFPQGTAVGQNKGRAGAHCIQSQVSTVSQSAYIQFSPTMASIPSVTTYNPHIANYKWRDLTISNSVDATIDPSASTLATTGVQIGADPASVVGGKAGDILCIHYSADSGL